jgi:hypothetical protein
MGYVVKTFSGVSESSAYEKAAVAWCTTHCGPVIADDYLYGSSYDTVTELTKTARFIFGCP